MRRRIDERGTTLIGFGRPSAAQTFLDRRQRWLAIAVLLVLGLVGWRWPHQSMVCLVGVALVVYASAGLFKVWMITEAYLQRRQHELPVRELADADLPRYTVLVPLFREGEVVAPLVRHLSRLDYAPDRLEVLLLCEPEDHDTIAAVREIRLDQRFQLIVCPDGHPRTKPRACNVGLAQATGELCVIYDAEDRPALDQLRRSAELFASSPDEVVCLQARLDYHNNTHNWLTRFFTVEYNFWFDLLLPALSQRDLPIPLGGTSNHFRTAVLRRLGGWDPYNVTEDADLGVRLYVDHGRTRMLDSVTLEEACSRSLSWIRQRTRWLKGYLQTWAVHTRTDAVRRRGGVPGLVAFHLLIGATPVVNLLNPLFWAMFVVFAVLRADWILSLFPTPLLYMGTLSLAAGNAFFVYISLLAVVRRQRWHLVHAALLFPVYWGLMSVATWRAVIQLATRPHAWEKTPHGLSGRDTDPAYAEAAGRPPHGQGTGEALSDAGAAMAVAGKRSTRR